MPGTEASSLTRPSIFLKVNHYWLFIVARFLTKSPFAISVTLASQDDATLECLRHGLIELFLLLKVHGLLLKKI